MRVLRRCVAIVIFVTGSLAILSAGPVPAAAQCSMMGGGGHEHSAMQGNRTLKPSGSEKKMRQSIDRLLSDERGRALLTETLLNDRAFMESLVQRLVAVPEWRDMVARRLDADSAEGSARSSKPESPIASLYVCPMHSEVTSATPADCPKCGMRLERRPVNSR